jgi:hypothetical protein
MATDALGRIYVGGAAVGESEESAYNPAVARLLPSGQRDPAWDGQLSGAFNPVSALRLEPSGGLIVGGEYRGLGRLDSEGVFDGAYDENTGWIDQADDPYPVGIIPTGSSGRVVVVGTRMDTALVNADGSLVQTFAIPPGFSYVTDAVAVDGAIMIAVGTTFVRFDLDEEGFHFATDRITVTERARRLVPLKVQRSGDASLPASVQIGVGPGTATILRDWVLFGLGADLRRTLHFPAGVRSRTVYLAVWDDRVPEGLETANFFLTRPIGAPLASPDAVTVEISD